MERIMNVLYDRSSNRSKNLEKFPLKRLEMSISIQIQVI